MFKLLIFSIAKCLSEKQTILLHKENEASSLVDMIELAHKFIEMTTLNNELDESLRVLNDKARTFKNEVKAYVN